MDYTITFEKQGGDTYFYSDTYYYWEIIHNGTGIVTNTFRGSDCREFHYFAEGIENVSIKNNQLIVKYFGGKEDENIDLPIKVAQIEELIKLDKNETIKYIVKQYKDGSITTDPVNKHHRDRIYGIFIRNILRDELVCCDLIEEIMSF